MSYYSLKQTSLVEGKTIEKVIINGVTKGICDGLIKTAKKISASTLYFITEDYV